MGYFIQNLFKTNLNFRHTQKKQKVRQSKWRIAEATFEIEIKKIFFKDFSLFGAKNWDSSHILFSRHKFPKAANVLEN